MYTFVEISRLCILWQLLWGFAKSWPPASFPRPTARDSPAARTQRRGGPSVEKQDWGAGPPGRRAAGLLSREAVAGRGAWGAGRWAEREGSAFSKTRYCGCC